MYKAVNNNILIEPIMTEATVGKSKLIIAAENYNLGSFRKGKILSVGDQVTNLNLGDVVYYSPFVTPLILDKDKLVVIRSYDVAVVE